MNEWPIASEDLEFLSFNRKGFFNHSNYSNVWFKNGLKEERPLHLQDNGKLNLP